MERDSIGMSLKLKCFHVCRYMLAGTVVEEKVEACLPTRIHDVLLLQTAQKQKVRRSFDEGKLAPGHVKEKILTFANDDLSGVSL